MSEKTTEVPQLADATYAHILWSLKVLMDTRFMGHMVPSTASVSPSMRSRDTEAVSGDFSYCHPQMRDVTNRTTRKGNVLPQSVHYHWFQVVIQQWNCLLEVPISKLKLTSL